MIMNIVDNIGVKFKYGDIEANILTDFQVNIYNILSEIAKQYQENIFITAITNGTHSKHSQHYKGLAIDVSVRNLSETLYNHIIDTILLDNDNYYALYETGGSAPHLHIQFSSDNLRERTKNKINTRRDKLKGVYNVQHN